MHQIAWTTHGQSQDLNITVPFLHVFVHAHAASAAWPPNPCPHACLFTHDTASLSTLLHIRSRASLIIQYDPS